VIDERIDLKKGELHDIVPVARKRISANACGQQ